MAMSTAFDLENNFQHSTSTASVVIRWARLGNPTGPPVVFVHGTPWSSAVWYDLAAALASRYDIYIYDHPGFGQSPAPDASSEPEDPATRLDASLNLRAEASAALIRHWKLQKVNVVAHDNGGLVTLRLLVQHKIDMASLTLIDVVALGASGLPFFKLVAENRVVFTAVPPHLMEGFIRGYVKSATHNEMSREIEDMLSSPWLHDGSQGPERFIDEMIQAHYRNVDGVWDAYNALTSKPLAKVIWGREDNWIPSSTAEKLYDKLDAEEVVIIDKAGHLVLYDQPSKLAVEVALWLNKVARH